MQDKGGRSGWVSKYPDTGASSSGAASSSQPARASSSNAPSYPSGYTPSPNPALTASKPPNSTPAAEQAPAVLPKAEAEPVPAHNAPAPSTAPLPSAASPVQISRVRALHTFEPTEQGELGFEKGDVIKVVDRGYKDWWRGQLRGKTGIFPVNYVVCIFLSLIFSFSHRCDV